MESQIAAFRHELGDMHSYDFVEGTAPAELFPELRSYYPAEDEYYEYWSVGPHHTITSAVEQLDKFLKDEGPYDGAIGFSMGASLISSYLMYKKEKDPSGELPFKSVVFFSGVSPIRPQDMATDNPSLIEDVNGLTQINLPSAHIYDPGDTLHPGLSDILCNVYEPDKRFVFHHKLGHTIPGAKDLDALLGSVKVVRRLNDFVATSV